MLAAPSLDRIASNIAKVALALVINVALFVIIPVLHDLFGLFTPPVENRSGRRVVAELVQPEKKPSESRRARVRKVHTARAKGISAGAARRFAPDLTVAGAGDIEVGEQDMAAMILEEGEADEPAVPIRTVQPRYSERLRELEVEGTLQLDMIIGRDGRVESVEIISSPHPGLSAAARKAVMTWRYRPARNKGVPVRIRARKAITFKLD